MHEVHPLITNDATLFGILAAMLGAIFYTSKSEHPAFKKFYSVIPALLLCYFLPSLLTHVRNHRSEAESVVFYGEPLPLAGGIDFINTQY